MILAALALVASAAHADPLEPKSRTTAAWLSVGSTLGGVGLVIAGGASHDDTLAWVGGGVTLLGPTAGHWYADEVATPGLLARGLGAGLLFAGAPKLICWSGNCEDQDAAWGLAIAGTALVLGGAAWDIATASDAADDWNRDHDLDLTIAPTAVRTPRGDTVPGLAFAGRF